MAPSSGTAKLLPELKSTSKVSLPLVHGNDFENWLVTSLCDRGVRILSRNWETPFGEVDLICEPRIHVKGSWTGSGNSKLGAQWVLIEIKSLISGHYVETRVSEKQKKRLRRVFQWLCENHGPGVAYLALVSREGQISWVPHFLD